MPQLILTNPQALALARYLQQHGFTTGLPLDSRDPLANAAQRVLDAGTQALHEQRARRRGMTPGRTLQACGADTPDGGMCTRLAGHDASEPHAQIGGDR